MGTATRKLVSDPPRCPTPDFHDAGAHVGAGSFCGTAAGSGGVGALELAALLAVGQDSGGESYAAARQAHLLWRDVALKLTGKDRLQWLEAASWSACFFFPGESGSALMSIKADSQGR